MPPAARRARVGVLVTIAIAIVLAGCGPSQNATLPPVQAGAALGAPSSTTITTLTADPVRTPGVTNPLVTQATIKSTICVSGWTATVRPPVAYTNRLKVQQLTADPRYVDRDPSHYEEDHLISLEIGGDPRDPGNLWPEPHPQSFRTDTEENRLHKAVCDGKLSLADAQADIVTFKRTQG